MHVCDRAFADGCGAFGERRRRRPPLERGARRGAGVSKGGTPGGGAAAVAVAVAGAGAVAEEASSRVALRDRRPFFQGMHASSPHFDHAHVCTS